LPAEHRHPWEFTVLELREHLVREYGEQGREAAETLRRLATLRGQNYTEILEPDVLRSMLLQIGIPIADFGLDDSVDE
jgi:hypothetical protein